MVRLSFSHGRGLTALDTKMSFLLFAILMAAVITGLGLHASFLKRLRMQYPHVWRSLGSPGLLLNNSPQNSLATVKYILKADFRRLDDPEFVRFCEILRVFDAIYLMAFTIYVILALVYIVHPAFRLSQ